MQGEPHGFSHVFLWQKYSTSSFLVFWGIQCISGVFCLEMQSCLLPNYNLGSIEQTCNILATVRIFCCRMQSFLLPNYNLGSMDLSLPLFFTSYNRACLCRVEKNMCLKSYLLSAFPKIIISP